MRRKEFIGVTATQSAQLLPDFAKDNDRWQEKASPKATSFRHPGRDETGTACGVSLIMISPLNVPNATLVCYESHEIRTGFLLLLRR